MILGVLLLTGPFVIPAVVDFGLDIVTRTYVAETYLKVEFGADRDQIKQWIKGGELVEDAPLHSWTKIRFYGSDRQKVVLQTKEATEAVLRNCSGVGLSPVMDHVVVKHGSPHSAMIRFWSFILTLPFALAGLILIVAGLLRMTRAQTPPTLPTTIPH